MTTDNTPSQPPRGIGRPPKGTTTMTAAQRQAAYRQRLAQARKVATLETNEARRAVLVQRLNTELAAIDRNPRYEAALTHRNAAAVLVQELVVRYALNDRAFDRAEQPYDPDFD